MFSYVPVSPSCGGDVRLRRVVDTVQADGPRSILWFRALNVVLRVDVVNRRFASSPEYAKV